jgi:hypothetical protein
MLSRDIDFRLHPNAMASFLIVLAYLARCRLREPIFLITSNDVLLAFVSLRSERTDVIRVFHHPKSQSRGLRARLASVRQLM